MTTEPSGIKCLLWVLKPKAIQFNRISQEGKVSFQINSMIQEMISFSPNPKRNFGELQDMTLRYVLCFRKAHLTEAVTPLM